MGVRKTDNSSSAFPTTIQWLKQTRAGKVTMTAHAPYQPDTVCI
ncbi:hypothetical protein ACVR05_01860 [Streptococcus caprae]